jgi:hypothetical protein
MNEIMMIYSIPKGNASIRITFNRKLFCYRVQSNEGKFDKKTKGILREFKKPLRSVIIFNKSQYQEVKKLCNQFKIIYD